MLAGTWESNTGRPVAVMSPKTGHSSVQRARATGRADVRPWVAGRVRRLMAGCGDVQTTNKVVFGGNGGGAQKKDLASEPHTEVCAWHLNSNVSCCRGAELQLETAGDVCTCTHNNGNFSSQQAEVSSTLPPTWCQQIQQELDGAAYNEDLGMRTTAARHCRHRGEVDDTSSHAGAPGGPGRGGGGGVVAGQHQRGSVTQPNQLLNGGSDTESARGTCGRSAVAAHHTVTVATNQRQHGGGCVQPDLKVALHSHFYWQCFKPPAADDNVKDHTYPQTIKILAEGGADQLWPRKPDDSSSR